MSMKIILVLTLPAFAALVAIAALTGCRREPERGFQPFAEGELHPGMFQGQLYWEQEHPQYDRAIVFRWEVQDDGTIMITGAADRSVPPPNLRIPPQITGRPVTHIAADAFNNRRLTSVTIPATVTYIGDRAFENNHLSELRIPEGVVHIERWAFSHNRLESIDLPSSLQSIGDWAFASNDLTHLTLPDGLALIGAGAFERSLLASLEIPPSVTYIGDRAFAYNLLSDLNVPSIVTHIGESVFIPYDHEAALRWELTEDGASVRVTGQRNFHPRIWIPSEIQGKPVTEIGDWAFGGSQLARRTSVTMPEGITYIGRGAFGWNRINRVVIPDSVTFIGAEAFAWNEMTSLTLGGGLVTIEDSHPHHNSGAFQGNALTEVILPDGVIDIGSWSFADNPLTRWVIPDSVTRIGTNNPLSAMISDVFVYEDGLLARIIDAGSAIEIVRYEGPETEVHIPSHIRDLPVTVIAFAALAPTFSRQVADLHLINVTIPDTVTRIEASAFGGNRLGSVIIPDSVTFIGERAFAWNNLASVFIPDSVTYVGREAFRDNELIELRFGSSLASIGERAFAQNQLTTLSIPATVTTIGQEAFRGNPLTSLTISEGVTSIGGWAFFETPLTSVVIPDSITSISVAAFGNHLTSITIGSEVTLSGQFRSFANGFDVFYESQGRRAGTYTLGEDGVWSVEFR